MSKVWLLFFVTLTYLNKYIPYIRKSDLELYNGEVFPIYRDFNVRRVRCVPLRPHFRSKGKFVKDFKNVFTISKIIISAPLIIWLLLILILSL